MPRLLFEGVADCGGGINFSNGNGGLTCKSCFQIEEFENNELFYLLLLCNNIQILEQ